MSGSTELLTGIVVTVVVLGGIGAGVYLLQRYVKKQMALLAEGRARFVRHYGLQASADARLSGVVKGVAVKMGTSRIAYPAEAHGEGPRRTGRMEMWEAEGACAGEHGWFICEKRPRKSYVDDRTQPVAWPDYHRAKLGVPPDWAPVRGAPEAVAGRHTYQIYAPPEKAPDFMEVEQLLKRLWRLDVFFVLMHQQKVRVFIPLNNFEEHAEQSFEKHERVLRLVLDLAGGR